MPKRLRDVEPKKTTEYDEAKLPVWAQDRLNALRRDLNAAHARLAVLTADAVDWAEVRDGNGIYWQVMTDLDQRWHPIPPSAWVLFKPEQGAGVEVTLAPRHIDGRYVHNGAVRVCTAGNAARHLAMVATGGANTGELRVLDE